MHVILYPGATLTVSAPSLIEITALADVQVLGVPPTAAAEAPPAIPITPVTVTVTPAPKP